MEGVRKQRSEDNVPGYGGEHPFIQESIDKSTALRKASGYEAGVKDVSVDAAPHDDGAAMQTAAMESSCDSIGSKSKPHIAPLEAVPEDVLSFEQRRKEILRLTREAEERKKRCVMLLGCCGCSFSHFFQAAGENASADGTRSERSRRAGAQAKRGGAFGFGMFFHFMRELDTSAQLLEAEEMRKNELQRRVEDLHRR